MDSCMYLLGYVLSDNRIFWDKDLNIVSYTFSLAVGDMQSADNIFPTIPEKSKIPTSSIS